MKIKNLISVTACLTLFVTGCMAQKSSVPKPHDAAPGLSNGIDTGEGPTTGTRPETGYDTGSFAQPGTNSTTGKGTFVGVSPDSPASQPGAVATNARPEQLRGTPNQGTSNLDLENAKNRSAPLHVPREKPNQTGQGDFAR